jgi:hypothetical protein
VGTLVSSFQGEPTAVVLNTAGDNVVITPGAGARLRIFWIGMSASQGNTGENLAIVKLGSRVKYIWNLGNPGAFSHRDLLDGAKGEALIVNLSQAYPICFNYTFEEVY